MGPYAPVALTFNKSLDYTTITSANFALYNGSTNLNASVSYSNDRRIVYLNTVLPYGATISVLVSTNVRDYNGNYLTAPYSSTFAMAATPLVSTPSVIQVRPTGSGAALNSPITLYMSAPMNASSVQSGIFVSQNGVLIQGSATLTPDRRGIVWAPGANYLSGATINVFLTPPAADVDGNQVGNYSASFRTATVPSPSVPLTEIGVTPCRYCQLGILNPVFDVQFSGPVNPATVTASSFYLTDPYNNPISGAISFLDGNTVIRFSPSAPLAASTYYYYVHLTTAIQDTFGNTFSGDSWGVSTSASAVVDNTPPTVQAVTPPNGSTGIGDNAVVKLVFSKIVDTLTIGAVNLSYGSTSLAYTTTFTTNYNGTQTVAILTPSSPLPDNATIAISLTGITDLSGNALPSQTASFQTGPGSDFTSATVITSINSYSSSAVPINSTFTATFSKALDPSTVTPSGFYVYISYPYYTTVSSSLNVSPDGRTVTIAPTSNLTPSQSYYVSWSGANDLDGNSAGSPSQYFTTAAAADTTPPTVVSSNPLNNNSGAPTNSWVEVDFNKAVRANSLGSITLSASGSVPFTATLNSAVYGDDTVVRLIPAQLLMPNTTYTVNVSGVQDVAGNVMSGTYTFSFTTGLNFQTQGIGSITPSVTTASGTFAIPTCCTVLPNVLDNPTFTVVFDHSVDYASFLHNAVVLLDQNNNTIPGLTLYYSLSTDQTTLTITTSGLAPASTYILYIGSYYGSSALWDIAGNSAYAYNYYNYHEFSTQ